MNTSKRIFAVITAFFVTLVLCVWVLLTALLATVYSPNFVSRHINDEYCTAAYNELIAQWSSYGEPALIPQKVFEAALSPEQFSAELLEYTQSVWNGDYAFRPDSEKIGEWLMTAFTDYAAELEIRMTDDLRAALETLRDTCLDAYEGYTDIPLLDNISQLVQQMYKPVLIVFVGVSLLLAALVFLSVRIHRYWFHGTRDLVYTLFATFLVLAPPAILVLASNPFAHINLNPAYLRLLLIGVSSRFMWLLLMAAILALLAGGVLLIVSERKHNAAFQKKF